MRSRSESLPETLFFREPELLTLDDVARLLRFETTAKNPRNAAWQWLRRRAVPIKRRGREILVERGTLAAILRIDGAR